MFGVHGIGANQAQDKYLTKHKAKSIVPRKQLVDHVVQGLKTIIESSRIHSEAFVKIYKNV